jgi:predicted nucleotidyltransferase
MFIEAKHRKIIIDIVQKYPYTFYIFGSRSKGKVRPLSDLDICVMEDVPNNIKVHMLDDFEESDLPFTVDIVYWNRLKEPFKNLIKNDLELLWKPEENKQNR